MGNTKNETSIRWPGWLSVAVRFPKNHGAMGFLRMQAPLLGLIALMFLIFFAQAAFGPLWYRGLMVVPVDAGSGW